MNLILGSGIMRIFAVAAVAVSVSPAAGQIPSAAKPQFDAWKACVMEKAERYSKSTDSAEAIARVALLACKTEKNSFWEQMIAEKVDPGARRGLQEMLEKSLTEDAAVFVMELRSRK